MSRRSSYLYFGFIFLAGILTMLCQITWIREYTTLFGIHAISGITLLATFSGCMAVGSYVFGKVADKKINKLFLFALMLIVIGIFIFLHPFLFGKVIDFYLYLIKNLDLGTYSVMFIRTTVSFFYFLIPASLMGGILPVLSKGVVRNLIHLGRQFGILYGFYTAGLMTGSFLTGFVLIRLWGIHTTLLIAASLSLMMALLSILFFDWEGKIENIPRKINIRKSYHSDEFVTIAAGKWKRRLLRIFTIGSFAAVTYKLVWIRMLVESSADKTSYFHTILSVSFLGCLALGNFVASRFADRIRKKFFVLAIIEILIGLTSILSIGLFGKMLYFLSQPSEAWGSWTIMMAGKTVILWILFLLPFTLTGFVFPFVTRMYAEDLKTLGQKIGTLGVLDVVGAIAASFIVTFIFIPLLGTYKVFVGAAIVNTGIGIFILLRYRRIKNSLRAILTVSSLIIVIGIAIFFSEKKIDTARQFFSGNHVVETRHEGSTANVDVQKNSHGDVVLYINGAQAVSSNPAELKGDKMLSCLPFLFKPDAEKVMIIGLGIGITAKSMADVGVPEIDIVEISPEVTNVAADAYAYVNGNILADENISITIEDGRSFLFRADKRYDIIICNAAHPRLGIALYTEEYYRLCREKLSHQGYLCQWLPTGWVTEDEFRSLIKSCTDVFPHVTLWHIAPGQTLLLASAVVQQLDFCQSQKLFNLLNSQGTLTSSGIGDVDSILAGLLADDATLRKYTREASVNTDVFPRVEFSRFLGDGPDKAIVEHLSSFRVSYGKLISFDNCPESAREVLDVLARKNVELREKLE